jgi:hypothetical protein
VREQEDRFWFEEPVDEAPEPVGEPPEPAGDPPALPLPAVPVVAVLPQDTPAAARRREAARRRAAPARTPSRRPLRALAVPAIAGAGLLVMLAGSGPGQARRAAAPRPPAHRSLSYAQIYRRVGREYGLAWYMLEAVGTVESQNGTARMAGVESGANVAGAQGPAQFLPSTWARYGVDADAHGSIDPYDPADAITAMAAYLKASGAPQDWPQALYAYNHSWAYVEAVMSAADRLQASAGPSD